jgi:osmotically-inducible protein OsmY
MTRLDDFRPTPESRKAFDDLLLASEVWSSLTTDQHTRSANIRVVADDGSVLVTGSAGSERVVKAILEVAGRVPGAAEVSSEVGVGGHWQW